MTTEPQLTKDNELLALLDAEGDAKTKILTEVIRSHKNSQSDLETEVKKFAGRTRWITLFTAFTFVMFLLLTLAGGVGYVLLSQAKEDKSTIESRLAKLQQTIAVVQATQIAMSAPVITPSPAFAPVSSPTPTSTATSTPTPTSTATSTPPTPISTEMTSIVTPTLSPTAEKSPSPTLLPSLSTATPTPNPLAFWVEKLECQIGQIQQDNTFRSSSAPTPCIKQVSIKENEALQITFSIITQRAITFDKVSLAIFRDQTKKTDEPCQSSPQKNNSPSREYSCTWKASLSPGRYIIQIWAGISDKLKDDKGKDIEISLEITQRQ